MVSTVIGVFDSGLGGLTVAAAVRSALPTHDIVYLGDTARVPYGTRSPATVVRYARNNADFLLRQGIDLLVVACNTASAHALGALADGSSTPVVGVVRPGARAALARSGGGAIAVLGTPGTIRSNAYLHAIHEHDPRREVRQIACPLFVPLVEEGWLDHDVTVAVAREYLGALRGSDVDTVILGCTHYPLIRPVIAAIAREMTGRDVAVVDSASAVADDVARVLAETGRTGQHAQPTTGRDRFCVTDEPDRTAALAARFWGGPVEVEHVDILV